MADEPYPLRHHAVEFLATGFYIIYVVAHVTDNIRRVL